MAIVVFDGSGDGDLVLTLAELEDRGRDPAGRAAHGRG